MTENSSRLELLAQRLYARRREGVIVPYVRVELDGWKPQENDCHANVDYWVLSKLGDDAPECKAVRGWLYIERSMRPPRCCEWVM